MNPRRGSFASGRRGSELHRHPAVLGSSFELWRRAASFPTSSAAKLPLPEVGHLSSMRFSSFSSYCDLLKRLLKAANECKTSSVRSCIVSDRVAPQLRCKVCKSPNAPPPEQANQHPITILVFATPCCLRLSTRILVSQSLLRIDVEGITIPSRKLSLRVLRESQSDENARKSNGTRTPAKSFRSGKGVILSSLRVKNQAFLSSAKRSTRFTITRSLIRDFTTICSNRWKLPRNIGNM